MISKMFSIKLFDQTLRNISEGYIV